MAVLGFLGSGKTDLIIKLLKRKTFLSQILKSFFYKDIRPILQTLYYKPILQTYTSYSSTLKKIVKFDEFDRLRKIGNVLLVFHESCDKNLVNKEFIKLATAGRHKGLVVIYVKHNLFQSRWS